MNDELKYFEECTCFENVAGDFSGNIHHNWDSNDSTIEQVWGRCYDGCC